LSDNFRDLKWSNLDIIKNSVSARRTLMKMLTKEKKKQLQANVAQPCCGQIITTIIKRRNHRL